MIRCRTKIAETQKSIESNSSGSPLINAYKLQVDQG